MKDAPTSLRNHMRRRLIDMAIILPGLGAVLILIPLIWPKASEDTGGVQTSTALIYLFAVWSIMISLAAVLSWAVRRNGLSDS